MDNDVAGRLHDVLGTIPDNVKLVAVSKFHPIESINAAYAAGQRVFGESREQELLLKKNALPDDIEWHFIGHLQTNKVKYIAPFVSMIDSVDSMKLLREIDKQAARHDRVIDVLLELHVAEEATKYGLTTDACMELLANEDWRSLKNVRIRGLMTMASNVDDEKQIRNEFSTALDFFNEVKKTYFPTDDYFTERSWGMSHDYKVAIDCGATMVRVGTYIFGDRVY